MANMLTDRAGVCTNYVREYRGTRQKCKTLRLGGLQTADCHTNLTPARYEFGARHGDWRNATEGPFPRN